MSEYFRLLYKNPLLAEDCLPDLLNSPQSACRFNVCIDCQAELKGNRELS